MATYWIARAKINEAVSYKKYMDVAGSIVEMYGGHFLARGGSHAIMEGTDHFDRFVIAEFSTMDDAKKCFNSSEYKNAASNRRNGSGDVDIVFVEGV